MTKLNSPDIDHHILLAVDIGGTFTKFALINPDGIMFDRWRIPTNLTSKGKYIPSEIAQEFKNKLNQEEFKGLEPIGMGIGIPGFATLEGTVRFSGNIGWKDYDIKTDLMNWFKLPIAVHNDCDMAALGEKFIGKAKNVDNYAFLTLGTGLGAGIVINGKLYLGAGGTAGEVGHIPIQIMNQQFKCTCGLPECAEPIFSATGLVNLFKKHKRLNPDRKSIVTREDGKAIWDGVRAGDKIAIAAAKEFAQYGGRILATIAMILNPQKIILGGGLAHDNETILKFLTPVYHKFTHKFIYETTTLELCLIGNDSGLYGAAYAALELIKK